MGKEREGEGEEGNEVDGSLIREGEEVRDGDHYEREIGDHSEKKN